MKKFEIGKSYTHKYIGDHNLKTTYTILARTAKTITATDGRSVKKFRIIQDLSWFRNAESVYPDGKYAKAPILSADKEDVA